MLDIPPAYLSDSFNAGLPRSNVFVCVEMYISPLFFRTDYRDSSYATIWFEASYRQKAGMQATAFLVS